MIYCFISKCFIEANPENNAHVSIYDAQNSTHESALSASITKQHLPANFSNSHIISTKVSSFLPKLIELNNLNNSRLRIPMQQHKDGLPIPLLRAITA